MKLALRSLSSLAVQHGTWCYAASSSPAFQHEVGATLLDLLLQFNMNLMPRYLVFLAVQHGT